jgi:hypothetical protein
VREYIAISAKVDTYTSLLLLLSILSLLILIFSLTDVLIEEEIFDTSIT